MINCHTYILPEHWAPALDHCDYSGLETHEIIEVREWLEWVTGDNVEYTTTTVHMCECEYTIHEYI